MPAEPTTTMPKPSERLNRLLAGNPAAFQQTFPLDSEHELAAAVVAHGTGFRLHFVTDVPGPLVLHWGAMKRARAPWRAPEKNIRPPDTNGFDDVAVQSSFAESDGLRVLDWEMPENAPAFIGFVLHRADEWIKHQGKNLEVPVKPADAAATPLDGLIERIAEAETGKHGWTLMHRFNLCHELIDEAVASRDAWAVLFAWLRYSAVRQLDWQRNYNTKPRELSHAQDRLTTRLAESFVRQPPQRDLIRLMLGSLGRGGDGQRIRDEILHIMHRHHIKEVGGTWMEQWHQKLHNNNTPDDVVICEAFLAFLHANGDPQAYHDALRAGGVTPERLAGFERPITQNPEWHPHLKDGLLHDFGNYLVLLKSVHSGTDLFTAVNAGGHLLDGGARDTLGWLLHHFGDSGTSPLDLVRGITGVRRRLHERLTGEGNAGVIKELIYLDLALEQALRTVIERQSLADLPGEVLWEWIGLTLENLLFTDGGDELTQCLKEWRRLPDDGRFSTDWALHAKAALDRLRREVEGQIDGAYRLLQPVAEKLGGEFGADEWVVKLFAEEVMRGQAVFLLSILIHHFDPVLRRQAKLGDWQVVSPSGATGEVVCIATLREVQGRKFERATILIAEKVHGDEEPPDGVKAVITPSSVDLVSHVAVRARNANLLFATCYDLQVFESLKAAEGKTLKLAVGATGDVLFEEAAAAAEASEKTASPSAPVIAPASPSFDVLGMPDFAKGRVGGKSWHLRELSSKLPEWIRTPRSVALPFGVFDAVLADPANASVALNYKTLVTEAKSRPEQKLAEVRACVLDLHLPEPLLSDLSARMKAAGLTPPADGSLAATRIKQVWASKWNDRAFYSRQARGFPHDAVQMAVLIQEVIEADHAFVIHTVNPFNGDPGEIYAEVVLGLGETLVGNHPGRAMSFVCPKGGGAPKVLAYPGKSTGLFGGRLIFRSDSNAEDLEGYAGAGLYDSVLLDDAVERTLDYTAEPLVWDTAFRDDLLAKIARIGEAVEQSFGSPQDIEGAVSDGNFAVVQTRPQVGL